MKLDKKKKLRLKEEEDDEEEMRMKNKNNKKREKTGEEDKVSVEQRKEEEEGEEVGEEYVMEEGEVRGRNGDNWNARKRHGEWGNKYDAIPVAALAYPYGS